MVSAAAKRKAAYQAYLTDKQGIAADAMPTFGYRPDYHSQAEADYQQLVQKAQLWGQSDAPAKALQNYEAANPIVGRAPTASDFSRALTEWMQYAPTASAGVLTSFAQANLRPDSPGVQEALAYDAQIKAQQDALSSPAGGSAAVANHEQSTIENLLAPVRAITRNVAEFAYAPLQAVQGTLSGIAGSLGILGAEPHPGGPDWGQAAWQAAGLLPPVAAVGELTGQYQAPNPWEQTDAGQALLAFMGQPSTSNTWQGLQDSGGIHLGSPVDTGDGWLAYDENSGVGLAQRNATYQSARNKFNESWTLGRGLASMAVDSPDDTLYKVGSGLVDAAVSIFLDPTIVGAKFKAGRAAVMEAKSLATATEDAQKLVAAERSAKAATAAEEAARQQRLADAEANLATLQKQWDKTPQAHKDAALSLLSDERALKEARPLDQAERDAWLAEQRKQATNPYHPRQDDLEQQREELQTMLDLHNERLAANKARRTVRGHIRNDAPTTALIDHLYERYSPAGLENEFADLSQAASGIGEQFPGGVLTNEVLGATKRGAEVAHVPAYSAAGETVAGWAGSKAPVLKGAQDAVENGDALASELGRLILKGDRPIKGMSRREVLDGYHAILTDPQFGNDYGHLFSFAASTGTTKHLAAALEKAGVDGITDVRQILGSGEGGVWWSNGTDLVTHALPDKVTSGMARDALPELTTDANNIKARIKAIDNDLKGIHEDRKAAVQAAVDRYDAYDALLKSQRLDEAEALREQLLHQAGIQASPDLVRATDGQRLYDFLFRGRHGARAFQALSEMDNAYDVMRVTGWDANTSARVAKATTRDEILDAIAPEMGLSIDHQVGRITSGLRYKSVKAVEQNRFFAAVERATNTFVPMNQRISYSDKDGMVKTLENYMDFYGLDRSVTRDYLNRIINEPDEFNQRNHVTGLFDELMNHLIERADEKKLLSAAGKEHLKNVIHEGTRVYKNAETKGHEYWQERIAADGWLGYMLSDGEHVRLPNAHLDSEFAQGGTVLPDPKQIMESMGRITGLINQNELSQSTYELVAKISTDWWRTLMLLRGAYVVRNIAEEQIRMFLSGGTSIFSNPIRMAAMAAATRGHSPAMERMIARFKTYDEGIDGTRFVVPKDWENELMDAHLDFQGLMLDNTSMLDNRTYRAMRASGIRMATPDESGLSGFSAGWGNQLLALRSSKVARLVVGDYPKSLREQIAAAKKAGGVDERQAVVDWLMSDPEGIKLRTFMGKSSEQMGRIMSDPMGLRQYLFESPGSVEARVREMTNDIPELREFLRTGVLKDRKGNITWETSGRRLGPMGYSNSTNYDDLASVLNRHYRQDMIGTGIKVPVSLAVGASFKQDRTLADWFFQISARMERTGALGPEWKHAYWNEVAKRAHLLDADALAKVRAIAKNSVPNKGIGPNPVWAALDAAEGKGPLGVNEVHAISGKKAGEHVASLFYDARKRNATWHQMRLVFPFGQAWGNTLKTWGQLSAKNPQQVYKFTKVWNAAQQTGSQAVYDAFNAIDPFGDVHYDKSQGFFYRDPNRGDQLMFKYPMAATPLAGLMASTQDANLAFASPVSGLNLAFSGDNPLPGLGPMATTAIGATGLQDNPGPIGDLIRGMAFPFGEPDPETGIVEQTLPAWARYAILGSGLAPGGGEAFRRQQQKGALIAAASRHDYGDLTDPVNQKAWFADADGIARLASFIRGFGAFVLPSSPVSVWETKDKGGNWLPVASVAGQYRQMEAEYGNDQAIVNLVDQYGEKGLAALISSTQGDKVLSDSAYKFILANPDDAARIGNDALALMFPGNPSPTTLAWQKANGVRRDLSWSEKQDAALGLLYRLQMSEVMLAAKDNRWNPDEIQQAKDAVLDRFGGKVPARSFDPNYYDNLLASFRAATKVETADSIPGMDTTRMALAAYDTALSEYRAYAKDPRATLSGKKAGPYRDELHQALTALLDADPNAVGVIDTLMSMTKGN